MMVKVSYEKTFVCECSRVSCLAYCCISCDSYFVSGMIFCLIQFFYLSNVFIFVLFLLHVIFLCFKGVVCVVGIWMAERVYYLWNEYFRFCNLSYYVCCVWWL